MMTSLSLPSITKRSSSKHSLSRHSISKHSISKLSLAITLGSLAMSSGAIASTHAKSSRIIGGAEASVNSYPWIVSVQSLNGEHFCGASLVAPEWVMTAAHCVEDESSSNMRVVVSEYDTSKTDSSEEIRAVTQIVSHPEYSEDHDIALLKLASPVNKQALKSATPEQLNSITAGSHLTVMGWGNRSTDGEDFPNILHEVKVNLISAEQCQKAYSNINTTITDNMLCAGIPEGGKDSCQGDSGGPLVIQKDNEWLQLGIVSFGEGCGQAAYPGVYTKVSAYNNWIEQAKNTPQQPGGSEPDNSLPDDGDTDDIDFDYEQPFELPDYVLIETDVEDSAERTLSLVNNGTTDLSITKVSIEDLDLYFDDDFEDSEEDIDAETEERQNQDEQSDDIDAIANFFKIKTDNCSEKTLTPAQSCDITLSFNEALSEEQDKKLKHFLDNNEEFELDGEITDEWLEDNGFDWELDEHDDDNPDYEFDENEYDDEEHEFGEHETAIVVEELLVIETNHADHDIVDVPLIGVIALPEPKLEGPDYLEFEAKNTEQLILESIELENISEDSVTITDISINGSDSFEIVENDCTSSSLEAGNICTLTVQFTPSDEAVNEGLLEVTYDNDEQLIIPMVGLTYSRIETEEEYEEEDDGLESEDLADMLDWYFNGDTPWGISNSEAFELVTDLLSENDESLLMTEIEGPATLDFNFNLEGDSAENELSFVVDGEVVKTINGDSVNGQHSTELSAGKHKVQWVYKKKSQNSNAKATVSNVRVKPKSSSASNTNENGGGSAGLGILALLTGLLGFKRFRK